MEYLKILMLIGLIIIPISYSEYLEEGSILDPPLTSVFYLLSTDINCTNIYVYPSNLTIDGCDQSGVYSEDIVEIYTQPIETYQNDTLGCYINIGNLTEDLYLKWVDSNLNIISYEAIDCNNNELCLASSLSNLDKNENYTCIVYFNNLFFEAQIIPDDLSKVINFVPIIKGVTPSYNFNISEGDIFEFDVDYFDLDEEDTISFSWVLNGIIQATTKVWQWIVSHTISNPDNPFTSNDITVYVNDNDGGIVSYSWDIGVNEVNLPVIINSFIQTPTLIEFDNNDIQIECDVTDEYYNQSDLNVTLYYKGPNDYDYIEINNTLEGGIFTANLTITPIIQNIGLWSFRCKAYQPGNETYAQQTDFESVEVVDVPTAPNSINTISPTQGIYDSFINIKCSSVTDPNGDIVYYDFYSEYNLKNGTRKSQVLTYNHTSNEYMWYTGNIIEQNNLTLGCRSTDGNLSSEWYKVNTSLKIQRDFKVLLLPMSLLNENKVYHSIPFSIVCDLTNTNNTIIEYSFADCRGDTQWDYLFNYESSNTVKSSDFFSCYYETFGTKTIHSGCVFKRINNSLPWDKHICKNVDDEDELCQVLKSYDLEVLE